MSGLIIRAAEVQPGHVVDVRIEDGHVRELGEDLPAQNGDREFEAAGGALVPGLHDHHIHLFALAAARASVTCGPPEVVDREGLSHALADGPRLAGAIRGVAYHESVAGDLDRIELDALSPSGVPVRIQHRSGAMWLVNSAAIDAFDLARKPLPRGVECNGAGELTGRIYYEDAWLRERMGVASIPDLAAVGRELASCGVTAVMDATPDKGPDDLDALAGAMKEGQLPQQVTAMGSLELIPGASASIALGPLKIMLREPALPDFDELVTTITNAHRADRGVAFHCVTRAELVMACGALREAGSRLGDRVEHASIAPPDLVDLLAQMNVWVVTQPGFVYERGLAYLRDVDPTDQPWLYRGQGFLEGGVALGGGTDAPYGSADPWVAISTAVTRQTREGETIGADEAVSPERALALFTSPIDAPGDAPPAIEVGAYADLCLLDLPWREFRHKLSRDHVVMTVRGGDVIWQRRDFD